jgi:hypothetical protein
VFSRARGYEHLHPSLLQGNQYGNEGLAFRKRPKGFPDDGPERLERIGRLHGVSYGERRGQEIAHLDSSEAGIHLTENFAHQSDRDPRAIRFPAIEDQPRLVAPSARDYACHSFVIGLVARPDRTLVVNHHNTTGIDQLVLSCIKILSTVGIR